MACTEHPEIDSCLHRYLGKSVRCSTLDAACAGDDSVIMPPSSTKKQDDQTLGKLLKNIEVVGDNFKSHFKSQKKKETIKLYVDLLRMMMMKGLDTLGSDATLIAELKKLKKEMDEAKSNNISTLPSPVRKKACTTKSLNGSNESDSITSTSTSIIGTSTRSGTSSSIPEMIGISTNPCFPEMIGNNTSTSMIGATLTFDDEDEFTN